jgi:5'-nucleotidase
MEAKASTPKRLLLVDLDGTIADLDDALIAKGIDGKCVRERESFEFEGELEKQTRRLMETEGFFASIPVVEHAVDTLKKLHTEDGWEVFFVTSPFTSRFCVPEKQDWILKHFGSKFWQNRLHIAKDKTVVRGAVLIDDNPIIDRQKDKSVLVPEWRHVLFSRNYNKSSLKPRIVSWEIEHVRRVLAETMKPV